MAEDDEGEIPVWRARMPGDPEIDREVKSGEELKEEEFHPIQQVINLIDDDDLKEDCDENWQNEPKDHWTENALRIQERPSSFLTQPSELRIQW